MPIRSHFILDNTEIDRWVLRSLRAISSAGTQQLQAEVRRRLIEEGVIKDFQSAPDENDVWCSLQRHTLSGRVIKYLHETKEVDRAIRYRVSEK
jgi:hypothetical protein